MGGGKADFKRQSDGCGSMDLARASGLVEFPTFLKSKNMSTACRAQPDIPEPVPKGVGPNARGKVMLTN